MKFFKYLSIFVLAGFCFSPVEAQMSNNPPEVGEKIRAMGAKLNRDIIVGTSKLYAPLLKKMPRNGVRVIKDQAYGSHERHKLDVYQPSNSAGAVPVVVYIHGGGFIRGDKKGAANIGTYFARNGLVSIAANYRLAPKNKWPSGAEDIARMIKWIKSEGVRFGINSKKIFLMGSSAGAAHVAGYVFFEEYQIKDDGVAGAILSSMPSFDLTKKLTAEGGLSHPGERGYFGADVSKYASISPASAIKGRRVPLYIGYAELDMPMVHNQVMMLINAVYERDKMLPAVKQVIGHNHISIIRHINTKDQSYGPDLVDFIKSN